MDSKMRVLIFTDSRGQHKPRGATHEVFPIRLLKDPRIAVDLYLCPFKWTTTLDFLGTFNPKILSSYDLVVLYTGIVEWSPRPLANAVADVYHHPHPQNLQNLELNTENYADKIVNDKKAWFDAIFGEPAMLEHFSAPFDVIYEGDKTINMYSPAMAERYLLPRLAQIPNLLFINTNRFVAGWDGDYWKQRPDNIAITHQCAALFSQKFPKERLIDLYQWSDAEVKKYTCDNLHLSAEGSEYIFSELMLYIMKKLGRPQITKATEISRPRACSPSLVATQIADMLSPSERSMCSRTTLIIGVKFNAGDYARVRNLQFLLVWLAKYYGALFDILIVEQGAYSSLATHIPVLPEGVRYQFLYNPSDYNRGWGYNVAVKNYCSGAEVVALMDTDVLTGNGFVESVLACHGDLSAVSPYRNIYYCDERETELVQQTFSYDSLQRSNGVKNPVTITGGVVIIKKSVFLKISGFEQYIGYGCEDRAMDVTLLNRYGPERLLTVDEVYVHLHHPLDTSARQNFQGIYRHLTYFYQCEYDPKVSPFDFIHRNCSHASEAMTQLLYELRIKSFGDADLYSSYGIESILINGQVVDAEMKNITHIVPELNKALLSGETKKALQLCQLGIERYGADEVMQKLFKSKLREIERATNATEIAGQSIGDEGVDTLIVLGNGPSLKYVMANAAYREILKRYHTLGLNAAYRAYDELDFWPTYHGCFDMIVVESHLRNYQNIVPRLRKMFLLAEDHLGNDIIDFEHPNLVKIRFDTRYRDSNEKILSTSFDSFKNWQNSGCNCVQIGLMLGYKRVVLLGMDASYKELLTEAEVVRDDKYKWDHLKIAKGVESNDNYWFSGYQQVGDKYNIPNAGKYHLPAWNALGLSEHRSKVINCTTETKISTIRRQSFEETFDIVPAYSGTGVISLRALGVAPECLLGELVRVQGRLYLIAEDGTILVRRFVTEAALNTYLNGEAGVDVFDVDHGFMELPCHGIVDTIPKRSQLRPGLTFMIRARNERSNVYFVLGSLKHLLANRKLNCEVLFVDNLSNDGTADEVLRVCREQNISNVLLGRYDVDVSPSGDVHAQLKENNAMSRSLDTYYNWCLDRVRTRNVIKWDCDFLAIQGNLLKMIQQFDLPNTDDALAIWCSGKTLFKGEDRIVVNEETMYNEFRVFSKAQGYRWDYAPRWEICSQAYMSKADKRVFTRCVFLELKDSRRNEFEFRSKGGAILSDLRDGRDNAIINALARRSAEVEQFNLEELAFDPSQPAFFGMPELSRYEATLEELDAMQSYWLNVYCRPNTPQRFAYKGNAIVQGLWVGEGISELHRMCLESFVKNGHCFVLYTYAPVENVPAGVVIMDARKLVPESMIYKHDGSYAGFSDLFRNKLLLTNGGWYVDLDIFCLRPFDIEQDIVFSLDYYHPDTVKIKLGSGEIIGDRYYVQTNPCKLPAGHELARNMYASIFKKLAFERLRVYWMSDKSDYPLTGLKGKIETTKVRNYLENQGILHDFEEFVGDPCELPPQVSFHDLLNKWEMSLRDVGQRTWGEIGPIMVTREVVSRGLEGYATRPEMFQGIVKYFEIEKFLDKSFDFGTHLAKTNSYSLDLFFTMWRRKGLLDKLDTREPCLLNYLRSQLQVAERN